MVKNSYIVKTVFIISSYVLSSFCLKSQVVSDHICGKWEIYKTESPQQEDLASTITKSFGYEFLKDGTYTFYTASGNNFKGKWKLKINNEILLIEEQKPKKNGKYNLSCSDEETTISVLRISQDSLICQEYQTIYHYVRSN